MSLSKTITLSALVVLFGSGVCLAQAKPPAASAPAATTPTSDDHKKAVSKACSQQADAKGLHGKERKKFRSECKRNDGKAA